MSRLRESKERRAFVHQDKKIVQNTFRLTQVGAVFLEVLLLAKIVLVCILVLVIANVMVNRPGVAGAVLQSPLSFIN